MKLEQISCTIYSDSGNRRTGMLCTSNLTLFGNPIYWNPAYNEYHLGDNQVLFLSALDDLILPVEAYQSIVAIATNDPQFFADKEFAAEMQAVHLVTSLLQMGILNQEQNSKRFYTPDFKNQVFREQNVVAFSQNKELIRFCVALQSASTVLRDVVLVPIDHWSDPRLVHFNRDYNPKGKSWIPIWMCRGELFFGPCFQGRDRDWTAIKRLQKALTRNTPLQAWASEQYAVSVLPPVPASMEIETHHYQAAESLLLQLLEETTPGSLYYLNIGSGFVRSHAVPQWLSRNDQLSTSYFLHSERNQREAIINRNGGYRTVSSSQTLEKISAQISPVTGILHSVHCLNPKEKGLKIFSAAFSKTPKKRGMVQRGDFVRYSLGKGVSNQQSEISAISEAIERHDALYDGTEARAFGTSNELDRPAVSPNELRHYSDSQYARFAQHPESRMAVERYTEKQAIHWTPATVLGTGESTYVPLTACYTSTTLEDERFIRFNSNGSATGNTVDEAILQGFLELVERDAVAIWWYNRSSRPSIDLSEMQDADFEKIHRSLAADWDYWVLDVTVDWEIPVTVAVAQHKQSKEYRFGLGAHLEVTLACKRALTELYQLIVSEKNSDRVSFDFSAIKETGFLNPLPTIQKTILDYHTPPFAFIDQCLAHCVAKANELGFDIHVVETTRTIGGLRTVKVLVPGLSFIWPETGNSRLYQIPVKLGWSATALEEAELNPMGLFI